MLTVDLFVIVRERIVMLRLWCWLRSVGLAVVLCAIWNFMPSWVWAIPIPLGPSVRLDIDGEHRFFYHQMNNFPLDNEGKTLGDPAWGNVQHRLRISPSLHFEKVLSIYGQFDFTTFDSLYGIVSPVGTAYNMPPRSQIDGFRVIDPRHLYLSWLSPIGLFRLGQMPSHWGLGILANDGQTPTGEFAAPRFGDIVERLIWAFPFVKPFSKAPIADRLFLAAAFDIVFRDENAELIYGDLAFQGAFSLFYRQDNSIFAGVYVAIRRQQDRDGRRIDAQAFDLYFKISTDFAGGLVGLDVAFEGAILTGFTDRIRTEFARDGVNLEAFGAVGRVDLRLPRAGIRVGFEMGFASGDNDPNSDTSRLFRFDPDYQPSMIMFPRVMAALTAHSADRAGDLTRVGFPPPGTDQLPSYGRLGNVFYIQPVIAFQPLALLAKQQNRHLLELKIGLLYARSAADFIDPFASFRAGGSNTTSFGRKSADAYDLGVELNISLRYEYRLWQSISIDATLLYGHLFPGAAFSSADGKQNISVDMLQARLTTRF